MYNPNILPLIHTRVIIGDTRNTKNIFRGFVVRLAMIDIFRTLLVFELFLAVITMNLNIKGGKVDFILDLLDLELIPFIYYLDSKFIFYCLHMPIEIKLTYFKHMCSIRVQNRK